MVDAVLGFVTLFIGWIIWSCVTFSKGQTPAKSIMGMRVVKQDTGVAATWGEMFLRQVVIPMVLGIVGIFLFGIPTIVAACMIFGGTLRQTGWDRMMRTVVVNDPQHCPARAISPSSTGSPTSSLPAHRSEARVRR